LNEKLDLSDFEQWGEKPFKKPVLVSIEFRNRAGVVTMDYEADYEIDSVCSRCLEQIHEEQNKRFSHTLVTELNQEDNDEYVVLDGYELDVTELVFTDIVLELPIKMLCSADCKGICQGCGKNLNKEKCVCEPEEWADSRLKAAFGELFS
ncbi:MAG: YceD family protein, partial [Oscillospiraceae bacterium]